MCDAIIDDPDQKKTYALTRTIVSYGSKQCTRKGVETLGPLCLCTAHAKMARDGLVDQTGQVACRNSRRDVHRYPHQFPNGLYDWVRKLASSV